MTEKQTRAQVEELAEAASTLVHNIRNPLQIISLQMNLLESSVKRGALQTEKVLSIVSSVERAVEKISAQLENFLEMTTAQESHEKTE